MRFIVMAAPALLVLAGCTHTEGGAVRIPPDEAKTRLQFFNYSPSEADQFIANAKISDADKAREAALLDYCGRQQKALVEAAIIGYLIDKGVSFLVSQADKALQDEIKKYTATYEATATLNFYERGGSLALSNKCMRITRVSESDAKMILMDYLVGFQLDDNERLKIVPLRLYYANPAVKTDNGKYGISIALSLESSWRQDNRNVKQTDYPSIPLLSETIDLTAEKQAGKAYSYKAYYDPAKPNDAKYKLAPLPSWSTYGVVQYGGNLTFAKATVAEAGHVPWLLEKAAELFSDNKDKIEDQVKTAIKKAAGLE